MSDFDRWKNTRLGKQILFLVEADKLKGVFRQSRLIEEDRKENDAEHSWHIALMVPILEEYGPANLDKFKVIKMLLIHDLVEIEVGDVLVYDLKQRKLQAILEQEAAKKVFGFLPFNQKEELLALWKEFEARQTPEAKFARALDRLQPLILNYFSNGQAWLEHQPTLDSVLAVNCIIQDASPELWKFAEGLIQESVARGYLK